MIKLTRTLEVDFTSDIEDTEVSFDSSIISHTLILRHHSALLQDSNTYAAVYNGNIIEGGIPLSTFYHPIAAYFKEGKQREMFPVPGWTRNFTRATKEQLADTQSTLVRVVMTESGPLLMCRLAYRREVTKLLTLEDIDWLRSPKDTGGFEYGEIKDVQPSQRNSKKPPVTDEFWDEMEVG